MLDLIGSLTLAVICAPQFGIYGAVGLDFALELAALIVIAVSIGISIPDLIASIALAVGVTVGINVGVGIGLPDVSVHLSASISAQLVIVLGLIGILEGVLNVADAELDAYTYMGPGSGLGGALGGALASDPEDVVALIFGATSSGTVGEGSIASVNLLGGGSGWESGLASVSFSAPPPGGIQAEGTPTIAVGDIAGNATKVVTGVTVTNPGAGYDPKAPPSVTFADSSPILGATNATPIVITLASTADITGIQVDKVTGPAAAGLMPGGKPKLWCAKVLTGFTIALYEDKLFTVPSVGSGAWTGANGGTVTGNGAGAAASVVMGGGSMAGVVGFFDGLAFSSSGLVAAGTLKLSQILAVAFGLFADLLTELEAEAKALASAKANFGVVPPTIAGNLTVVAGIDANLTAALQFFPPLPSIQANLSAGVSGRAAVVASLLARIGLQLGFGSERLTLWKFSGPGTALGPALSTALAAGWPDLTPASAPSNVVALVAKSPAAAGALSLFFPAAA